MAGLGDGTDSGVMQRGAGAKRAFAGRGRIVGGGWLPVSLSLSFFLEVRRGFFLGLILYQGVNKGNK